MKKRPLQLQQDGKFGARQAGILRLLYFKLVMKCWTSFLTSPIIFSLLNYKHQDDIDNVELDLSPVLPKVEKSHHPFVFLDMTSLKGPPCSSNPEIRRIYILPHDSHKICWWLLVYLPA